MRNSNSKTMFSRVTGDGLQIDGHPKIWRNLFQILSSIRQNNQWIAIVQSLFNLASLFFVGLLSHAVFAASADREHLNPLGCLDVGYQFELKVLDIFPSKAGARNSLYFIRNKLPKSINLYQMRGRESSRSAFLNHQVKPGQWAVLSTSEKELKYICTVDDGQKTSYGKIVDCGESLQVCEFARVRFGLNTRGNYWVVNSNTRNGAIREVVRYGIIPQ